MLEGKCKQCGLIWWGWALQQRLVCPTCGGEVVLHGVPVPWSLVEILVEEAYD